MANSGSKGERDVAKYLTFGLTGQNEEYAFGRSPGSGSIATVTGTNPALHGDIIPIKPEAEDICNKFVLECKSGYSNASLDKHLKYNKADPIVSFGNQCVEDAIMSDKHSMLIFKKKGFSTPWLGISKEVYNKLQNNLNNMRFVHLSGEDGIELPQLYFFEMHNFFDIITSSTIKEKI